MVDVWVNMHSAGLWTTVFTANLVCAIIPIWQMSEVWHSEAQKLTSNFTEWRYWSWDLKSVWLQRLSLALEVKTSIVIRTAHWVWTRRDLGEVPLSAQMSCQPLTALQARSRRSSGWGCVPESNITGMKKLQSGSTDPVLGSRGESCPLEGVSEEFLLWSHKPAEKAMGEEAWGWQPYFPEEDRWPNISISWVSCPFASLPPDLAFWPRVKQNNLVRLVWSTNREMDKEDRVHIYYGILLSHETEQNCAICRDMDGPRHCHLEWNQKEKNKYCILMHVCGI